MTRASKQSIPRASDGSTGFAKSVGRRSFLRVAVASPGLIALAQLRALPAAATGSDERLHFLSAWEAELMTAIGDRIVASGNAEVPSFSETGALASIDRTLAALDPAITAQLPLAIRLFEYGPLLFDLSFTRFSRMSEDERDASLRSWMTSRLELRRVAFAALRNLALLGYYGQPETWRAIGYAGPLIRPAEVTP